MMLLPDCRRLGWACRGIEATLVADGSEAGGGAADDAARQAAAAAPPKPLAAANGAAAAAPRARGGRVAALNAAAAAGEGSGSDGDLSTDRDWVVGGGENPYQLQRRATARHGERPCSPVAVAWLRPCRARRRSCAQPKAIRAAMLLRPATCAACGKRLSRHQND
jgi:pyruvate/2-oxoglutarate dehydrogenase complex dihydrolipoamide acyltransferase (E2) component